jgi:hypothetical protein
VVVVEVAVEVEVVADNNLVGYMDIDYMDHIEDIVVEVVVVAAVVAVVVVVVEDNNHHQLPEMDK